MLKDDLLLLHLLDDPVPALPVPIARRGDVVGPKLYRVADRKLLGLVQADSPAARQEATGQSARLGGVDPDDGDPVESPLAALEHGGLQQHAGSGLEVGDLHAGLLGHGASMELTTQLRFDKASRL